MWQYPQQKQNCGVSAWKNKNIGKKILILCLEKTPYMKKSSPGRYERRNRSVLAV